MFLRKHFIAFLIFLSVPFSAFAASQTKGLETPKNVTVSPGQDVPQIVRDNPAGSIFVFKSGNYFLNKPIFPKDNDQFSGESGVVLIGAHKISDFTKQGPLWAAKVENAPAPRDEKCESDHPRCGFPGDLFFDNVPLRHAATQAEVANGAWFFDYPSRQAYLGQDPSGHAVEMSVVQAAFGRKGKNVTVKNFTIEKFASDTSGCIQSGQGWHVEDNEVRLCHGSGIGGYSDVLIKHNFIHDNGRIGITFWNSKNGTVEDNEISKNNYAGFRENWHAGGAKFGQVNHLTVRRNNVHDNLGIGLWTDVDSKDVLYEDNKVVNNKHVGIHHEISYDAVIRNNVLKANGWGDDWLWGAQVILYNSRNTQVYRNKIEVTKDYGQAVMLMSKDRGAGRYGARLTTNNSIKHNDIIYLGGGYVVAWADFTPQTLFGTNHFDYNAYHYGDAKSKRWVWQGKKDWSAFKKTGQEAHGTVEVK